MRSRVIIVLLLVVGSTLVVISGSTWLGQNRTEYNSLVHGVLQNAQPLTDFELTDHTGRRFGSEQLSGHWSLLFLGYTSCPDICPTTMLTLRAVVGEIRAMTLAPPMVILLSVDPARDDLETLGNYVTHFDPHFIGVQAQDDQLRHFALQLGAMFEREPPRSDGRYDVAHNASIFLIGPDAKKHAVFSPPHDPVLIATQFAELSQPGRSSQQVAGD